MDTLFLLDKPPCGIPSRAGRAILTLAETLARHDTVRILASDSSPAQERQDALHVEGVPEGTSRNRVLRAALAEADLVVAWGTDSWVTSLLAPRARHLRGRLVHVPLGYHPFHLPVPGWRRALYRATHRRLARQADPLVVQTEEEGWDARRLAPRAQPVVLPLGHDPEVPRRLARAGRDAAAEADLPERYALVLGPEGANRRLRLALAACRGLDLPLVHLGTPPLARGWRGLFHVRPATPEAYYGIFGGASVLLSPLQHDPLGHELLDALCLGVPFVAHATGAAWGLSSLSRCPLFTATERPEAWVVGLARGLAHLAEHPPPAEGLRRACDAHAWTRLAPSWRRVLRERAALPSWEPPREAPLLVHGDDLASASPAPAWEAPA